IVDFVEKPKQPRSNKASMGIYIFNTNVLRQYLLEDEADTSSSHDFGKDVIPKLLSEGMRLTAYAFRGYWKDVGTVKSLWEANMDLIGDKARLDLNDREWRIYSRSPVMPAHYIGPSASARCSIVSEGCEIDGMVENSVLFTGVRIGPGAVVKDSVLMPGTRIGANATVKKAILGEDAMVGAGAVLGDAKCPDDPPYDTTLTGDITLVASGTSIASFARVPAGMIVNNDFTGEEDAENDG
ncbi:MAG TPA: sugar phosphate nucleotidyltransferase, partial [Clostridia bacterium]|nr:sugar phosphate nucleotidyltransferase [Clostridia bacterium]